MLKCGIVTALVLVTTMVSGAPTIRMQMCGSQLANTLAQICSAYGYHDPFSQTRRVNSPSSGVNTTPNRLRVRRGVADECCKTGCTLDTMEQYCSAPLTPAQRARFLQQYQSNALNRILQEVPSGSSLNAGSKISKDPKNDLSSKVRRQQDKKGQRGNNRCRCRRRRRRGKVANRCMFV